VWKIVEALAWAVALVFLAYAAVGYIDRATGSRQALRSFEDARASEARARPGTIDQTLWSPQRVAAWQSTLALPRETPLAVLRIARIHLEVPVLEGTDEVTLNRAVGHIADTAAPGDDGNSGIAGHRDGFFRGLKDVGPGDTIELETRQGTETYRIERTWIVDPEDVSVLDPISAPALTLVTCYPFYFIGPAPQRFIVRAVRAGTPRAN
jgi:sortase A